MISVSILTPDYMPAPALTTIDLLIGDEPDQIGAARIVTGNVFGSVKAIIVGNDDLHEGCLGPMMGGSLLYSCDSRFRAEVTRVLARWTSMASMPAVPFTGEAVALHDRYETPAQYAALSA